jgi:hypothetical protein
MVTKADGQNYMFITKKCNIHKAQFKIFAFLDT